jgi:hypothetical protein
MSMQYVELSSRMEALAAQAAGDSEEEEQEEEQRGEDSEEQEEQQQQQQVGVLVLLQCIATLRDWWPAVPC